MIPSFKVMSLFHFSGVFLFPIFLFCFIIHDLCQLGWKFELKVLLKGKLSVRVVLQSACDYVNAAVYNSTLP